MSHTPAKALDTGTALAVDRTRLAYERTLMAWVRTAVSLISFGFTIYKFFEFESGKGAIAPASSLLLTPRHFGMIMISTGLIALALASFDHYRNMKRIREQYGEGTRSVSLVVAVIVSGLGILALVVASLNG
jgi:putative membrane protein